jgi:hypothetical protein
LGKQEAAAKDSGSKQTAEHKVALHSYSLSLKNDWSGHSGMGEERADP